jgi:hypothetical protein
MLVLELDSGQILPGHPLFPLWKSTIMQTNEISTLIAPYNGRWPTRDDRERILFEASRRKGFDQDNPSALCVRFAFLNMHISVGQFLIKFGFL